LTKMLGNYILASTVGTIVILAALSLNNKPTNVYDEV